MFFKSSLLGAWSLGEDISYPPPHSRSMLTGTKTITEQPVKKSSCMW